MITSIVLIYLLGSFYIVSASIIHSPYFNQAVSLGATAKIPKLPI